MKGISAAGGKKEVFYLPPEMVGLICKLLPEGSVGTSGQNTVRFGVKTFINTEIIVDHEGNRAVECLQVVQIGNFADLAQDIEIFRCCKIRIHQQAGDVVGRKDSLHGLDFPIEASVIGAQLQDREAAVPDFVRGIHFLQNGSRGIIGDEKSHCCTPFFQGTGDGQTAHQMSGRNCFISVCADID